MNNHRQTALASGELRLFPRRRAQFASLDAEQVDDTRGRVSRWRQASNFDFFQTVLGGSFSPFSAKHVINVCSCAGI